MLVQTGDLQRTKTGRASNKLAPTACTMLFKKNIIELQQLKMRGRA